MKTIFLNYRRDDSSSAARGLRDNLNEAFGEAVFMDYDEIRVGDTWPETLDSALDSASVLLVVIGPTWLRMPDVYGRRRLDKPDDWVRKEIERSLARGIVVIPVLIGRATMPPREALPMSIAGLVDQQYVELRETHWKQDLAPLIDRLAAPPLNFKRVGEPVPVAEWRVGSAPDRLPRALTDEELQKQLSKIKNWAVVKSPLPGKYPKTRTELSRGFRFKSFASAVSFMQSAVGHIDLVNHHPRWENVFRTVTIYLSTWDSGHVISQLDFDMVNFFEDLFKNWESDDPERPK